MVRVSRGEDNPRGDGLACNVPSPWWTSRAARRERAAVGWGWMRSRAGGREQRGKEGVEGGRRGLGGGRGGDGLAFQRALPYVNIQGSACRGVGVDEEWGRGEWAQERRTRWRLKRGEWEIARECSR